MNKRITQTKTNTKTVVMQTLTPNLTKTATPTPTRTNTHTYTPTRTGTVTQTRTPTAMATHTRTATPTPTPILGASSNPNLAGTAWKFYYLAGSERIAMRIIDGGSNQLYYLFTDHLGSTSEVRRADGSLHSRQYYRAFGEERYTSGALPTDRTYTGQREIEFGLVHYEARAYDPLLARWVQPDAIIPEASQGIQAWDRYAYVNNSPSNFTDMDGHRIDDGCSLEGCCGDSSAVVHTILLSQRSATARKPIDAEAPMQNQYSKTNLFEWLSHFIGLSNKALESMLKPQKNVTTFLTYSEVDGMISDILYSVWNNSETVVYVRDAFILAEDWRNAIPLNKESYEKSEYSIYNEDSWWIMSVEPKNKDSVSIMRPESSFSHGLQPFSYALTVDITIRYRLESEKGSMPHQDHWTIRAPRRTK